jgi:hypothetical protein
MAIAGAVLMRYGVPLDEYGNSPLLMSGMVAFTGGLLLVGLFMVARNLNRIAERLEIQPMPLPPMADMARADPPPRPAVAPPPPVRVDPPGPLPEPAAISAPEPKPEPRAEPRPEPAVAAPARKPAEAAKPSLFGGLFGSRRTPVASGRKEAAPAPAEPARVDLGPLTTVPEREPAAPPRVAPPPAPVANDPPEPRVEPAPSAQIYKSGVIDGMAYTLYVDGSIEAELPQGRIRFASVEELQKYLAGRSA